MKRFSDTKIFNIPEIDKNEKNIINAKNKNIKDNSKINKISSI